MACLPPWGALAGSVAWAASLALAAGWVAWLVRAAAGWLSLGSLREAPAQPPGPVRVSVVFAARNEASTPQAAASLTAAVRSMLGQRGVQTEVVAVDDRSTDATGAVLDRLARELGGLRVLRVRRLPAGWLGKPHALAAGARAATGRWILFTDADVVLDPTAVARAVWYAERRGLDHLAVAPHLGARGLALQCMLASFALAFVQSAPPWRVRAGRAAAGVGAFNLVRAATYRSAGGHGAIRMRPDDDVQLARLLQAAGARQEFLPSGGLVYVPWYPDLASAVRGFEKNAYAAWDYSWTRSLVSLGLAACAYVLPACWTAAGLLAAAAGACVPGWPLAALALAAQTAATTAVARLGAGLPARAGLLCPAGAVLLLGTFARAVWLAERRRGVVWRDTFYSLAELRAARRPGPPPRRAPWLPRRARY